MHQRILLTVLFVFFQLEVFSEKISYTLDITAPHLHYVNVEMQIPAFNQRYLDIKMPVWTPGSYLIREFERNVEAFNAFNESGKEIPWEKVSKNCWRVYNDKPIKVKVNYRVYAFEQGIRTSFVDAAHALIAGTSMFMFVDGHLNMEHAVVIKPYHEWKVISTSLEAEKNNPWKLSAPDYDVLADSPIEIGNHDVLEFESVGIKHRIAMYGAVSYEKEKFIADIKKIIEAETKIFGENPAKNYTFIIHHLLNSGGGLEHLNSCVLQVGRYAHTKEASYRSLLNLIAHEYFHLWNVKRLRPAPLGPFDYNKENYTTLLWFAEGFTSYFDELVMFTSGLWDEESLFSAIENNINAIERSAGNKIQPVSESSFDAWIKYYRPNENSANTTVSYYTKGALLGALLDLFIIDKTLGQKNLDDLMKAMYLKFYKELNRGFTERELQYEIEEICKTSAKDFFEKYVRSTAAIPYNDFFNAAGIDVVNLDKGRNEPWFGASVSQQGGKWMVTGVERNSPAESAGINVNDELISINTRRIVEDFSSVISGFEGDEEPRFTINRNGYILEITVKIGSKEKINYALVKNENPNEQQKKNFGKWMRK